MPEYSLDLPRELLIAWTLLPFLTPNRTQKLLASFGCTSQLADSSPHELAAQLTIAVDDAAIVKNALTIPTIRTQVTRTGDRAVTLVDQAYPPLLKEIFDPPPALFYRGDLSLLSAPAVAVVGSRRASPYGINAATRVAADLADHGVTVVSGLARGIDAAAHAAALDRGGSTIAILGTGIDIAYPRNNRRLFEKIAERGLVVTQFPDGTPPLAQNFPIRNRIISGLSLGTVIVEATKHSGSLITARMVAEQGREVFAVPGSMFSSASEGPHRLIQYGAKLLHEIEDLFEELPSLPRRPPRSGGFAVPEGLLSSIPPDEAISVDELSIRLDRPVHELSLELMELEAREEIRSVPGGRFIRNPIQGER